MKQIYIYIYIDRQIDRYKYRYTYNIYKYIFNFQQFETMRSFGDSIYIGKFSKMRQKWI